MRRAVWLAWQSTVLALWCARKVAIPLGMALWIAYWSERIGFSVVMFAIAGMTFWHLRK